TTPSEVVQPTLETPLIEEIGANGEVVPERWASLACSAGATSLAIDVATGDAVAEGQLLATCHDARLTAAVSQAKANLTRAQEAYARITGAPPVATIASAEAALANARAQFDRLERAEAEAIELAAAQADIDAAEANLASLKAGASDKERVAAAQDVQAAERNLEQAEAALSIVAPFDGVIAQVQARSGEAIGALQPVLVLADLSRLQVVTTDLSEVDVLKIRVGQPVRVVLDALAGQTLPGEVVHIAPRSTGTSSVYYPVTIALDTVPEGLRWGMTAYIIFNE
ncbi:MAG: HlyD family efflux transporter periplasmic adaptor subunit, partial [Anaerolineae bacterium]